MDARTCIRTKRDSRSYAEREIPDDLLQTILTAGRMAGSSKNSEPCRYVVLREGARKAELAACGQFAQHVPSAPLVIAVVLTPGGGTFDAGRASQNMMLAAWEMGITSCPVSMHDRECAGKVLRLPDGHQVAIVLAFGYPASEESLHRGIPRTPLGELVSHEGWGG